MEFMVLAHDYRDAGALDRRMAARDRHMERVEESVRTAHLIYGATILDSDRMAGSILICNFNDRSALDAWLNEDPYVSGRVWEHIEVRPCRSAPWFTKK